LEAKEKKEHERTNRRTGRTGGRSSLPEGRWAPASRRPTQRKWRRSIGAKVHKNGKIAKGTCSVDGVRYRLDARKDDEGVWQAKLKNEDDHGEATLRWVEENGRFEGTLTLEEHQHRLFMRRVRPLQAEPEPLDE
jgi:hypothetical protein